MWLALAEILPASVALLCVNRPISLDVAPWKHPAKFWRGVWRTRVWADGGQRLHVMTPRLPFHDLIAYRIPAAARLNRDRMGFELKRVLSRLYPGTERIIQWVYHPIQNWVFGIDQDWGKIYECYDEYSFSPTGEPELRTWNLEKRILSDADLTFVTTQGLKDRRDSLARRFELLPNGVPDWYFENSHVRSDLLAGIPRPRFVYLGNARSIVDFQLLYELFKKRPDWYLVFLGPVERAGAVAALKRLPNVRFFGVIPQTEVPQYLRCFDVGLIPFRDNDFTRVMTTLKLCEYLSAGLPVVATDLPEFRRFDGPITLTRADAESFERAITDSLVSDRTVQSSEAILAARPYAWSEICRRSVAPVLADVFHW